MTSTPFPESTVFGVTYRTTSTGAYYHRLTPDRVIEALEYARENQMRVVIVYGDPKTGKPWSGRSGWSSDEGTVSLSMGGVKIPIILANSRSTGGPGILTSSIVRIFTAKKPYHDLYRHPDYQRIPLTIKGCEVYNTETMGLVARFDSPEQASRYVRRCLR